MEIYDLSYYEEKYLRYFPYLEVEYSKRIIMLCEIFQLFSPMDKLNFIKGIAPFCAEYATTFENTIISNLIINSFFLGDVELKKSIIDLVLICAEHNNIKNISKLCYDIDVSVQQYIKASVASSNLDDNSKQTLFEFLSDNDIKKLSGDVLFVIPNFLTRNTFLQPPIDALLAAQMLKSNNLKVSVLDLRIDNKPIYQYDLNFKSIFVSLCPYDLVQNYFTDYKYEYAISLTNYLAMNYENIYAYGPYFSFDNGTTKKLLNSTINIVVGEIEQKISSVLKQFHIDADANKDENIPLYDLVDLNDYYTNSNDKSKVITPWVAVLANRGCPFNCSFCYCFFGKKHRKRDINNLILELKELEKRNVKNIFFIDSTFTLDKAWIADFCEQYRQNELQIKYQIETRLDCIDEDVIRMLSSSGCNKIWFGLEALSDDLLFKCNKQTTEAMIFDKLLEYSKFGVELGGFFIVGLPYETKANFDNLFVKMTKLSFVDIQLVVFTPRPNTRFYEFAKEQYPFIEEDIRFLSCVRGIVKNNIKRSYIYEKLFDFYNEEKI